MPPTRTLFREVKSEPNASGLGLDDKKKFTKC